METLIENESERKTTTTGVGIACFTEGGKISSLLVIHTPSGQMQKKLESGGSPEDFNQWKLNMAMVY